MALAVSIGLATGCREEIGPEVMKTTRVTGVVREAGHPVGGGWIEFVPVEGTVGNFRSSPIRPDGSFDATRVAVGRQVIGLIHAPIQMPGGQVFRTFTSPIRRVIPPGTSTTLDIDLVEEAIRAQMARAPGR